MAPDVARAARRSPAGALIGWSLLGLGSPAIAALAPQNALAFVLDASKLWLTAVVALLAWPYVAPAWARWWSRLPAGGPGRASATTAALVVLTTVGSLAAVLAQLV